MVDENNLRSGGADSSNAYVLNRRRYIDHHIAVCEPSGNNLRDFQSRIDVLRAISGSPGVALRGILSMIVENVDQLTQALEIQLHELGGDQRLEPERRSIHHLFSEIARIREGAVNALSQLPRLPQELECIGHENSGGASGGR